MVVGDALHLGGGGGINVGGGSIGCYAGLFCFVKVVTAKYHCHHDIFIVFAHIHKDLAPVQILELQKWKLLDCMGLAGMAL